VLIRTTLSKVHPFLAKTYKAQRRWLQEVALGRRFVAK